METKDEYYRMHIVGMSGGRPVAADPLNGISKLLQASSRFRTDLQSIGPVVATTTEIFSDEVASKAYVREVLAAAIGTSA